MDGIDQKLYEEVATTWRHFAAWREKTLGGYLTVLAGLGFAFAHATSEPRRTAILLGGAAVSIVFWILDVRTSELLNACQAVGQRLEESKGAYSALASARATPRPWLTYSGAMDGLAGTVVAGCSVAGLYYLAKTPDHRWESLGLAAGALLLAGTLTYRLHRKRTTSQPPALPSAEAKQSSGVDS